jgi:hypothetical protein
MENKNMMIIPRVLVIFMLVMMFFLSASIALLTNLNATFFFTISGILLVLSLYAIFVPNPGGIILELGSLLLFFFLIYVSVSINLRSWIPYVIVICGIFFLIGRLFDVYSQTGE